MRKKLDKVAEVKRLSNIIRGIQTEISKQEEKLSELKRYRMFIDQLTPAKYRKSKKKSSQSEKAPSVTSETSSVNTDKGKQAVGQSGKASRTSNSKHSATNINRRDSIKNSRKDSRATTSMTKVTTPEEIIDESSDDEEVELYFKVTSDSVVKTDHSFRGIDAFKMFNLGASRIVSNVSRTRRSKSLFDSKWTRHGRKY